MEINEERGCRPNFLNRANLQIFTCTKNVCDILTCVETAEAYHSETDLDSRRLLWSRQEKAYIGVCTPKNVNDILNRILQTMLFYK
jgi:hypothetical protein